MNILIDIGHPAHVNFFKNTIKRLQIDGNNILICVLNRGKLPFIVKKEYKGYEIKIVGKHKGTKLSIIFDANILRFFSLFKICLKYKPDIGISTGSFILGFVLKLFKKPNIFFDDDPDRKLNIILEKLTSTELFFPIFYNSINDYEKIKKFNALKEWAYLSPKYFTPTKDALLKYKLFPKEYIFVREVSTGSLNYVNQKSNIISSIANKLPENFKVLFSLEDKSTINLYPEDWILLEEPVDDIHSLIYYSKLLISSGDSMAREGSMLGVPSIYCGIRDMAANKVMIDKGMLFHVNINDVPEFVNKIINEELLLEDQKSFRNKLMEEWIDMPEFIYSNIEKYKK